MSLQDITITGSIGSIATQSYGQRTYVSSTDDQSFPLEQVTGSYAGVWPEFVQGTDYTVGLVVNVTQSWSGSNVTPLGIVPYVHNTMEEFVNGEFSGSSYVVNNGSLTDLQCQQFLTVSTIAANYSIFQYFYILDPPYNSGFSDPNNFFNTKTAPNPGQILVGLGTSYSNHQLRYLKISKYDQKGNDNSISLQELTSIVWNDSLVGKVSLTVISITEFLGYYLYEVVPFPISFSNLLGDVNYLDYTLHATSSWSSISGSNTSYTYLTSSWLAIADSASGFSNGQYSFPLTPNFNVQATASINLTLTTPATFSWAINGYDDTIYPHNINYAYQVTGSSYNLNAGSYTLVLSSSFAPVQSDKFEIDALLLNNQVLPNPNLLGTGSITPHLWNLPISWSGYQYPFGPTDYTDYWKSLEKEFGNYRPFDGVFLHPNVSYDTVDVVFENYITGLTSYFTAGTTYQIDITIPSPTYFDAYPVDNTKYILGPSSAPLTCSLYHTNLATDIIGYIPSGAYGTFSFIYKATSTSKGVCILAPSASSQINSNSGIDSALAITNITARITSSATINNLSFKITQSHYLQNSTSSIIFEPYLTSLFTDTDCDVLMNNYSENDYSHIVHNVLYENGGTIPSNLIQIISGTAEPAEVNDYLYNAHANTLPRYLGVRTTSKGENLPYIDGLSNEELSSIYDSTFLDVPLDKVTPNVANTTTYFAYFNNLQSNNPIYKDTTSPILTYLIREDGEVFPPSVDEATYYNIIDSFQKGKKAYVTLFDNTSYTFTFSQSILLSGESYTPILYTYEVPGNPVQWTNALQFTNLQNVDIAGTNYDTYVRAIDYPLGDEHYTYTQPGEKRNIWYSIDSSTDIEYVEKDTNAGFKIGSYTAPTYGPYYEFSGAANNFVEIEAGGIFYDGPSGGRPWRLELWLNRGGNTYSLGYVVGSTISTEKLRVIKNWSANVNGTLVTTNNFLPQNGDKIWVTVTNQASTFYSPFLGSLKQWQRPGYPPPYLKITTKNLNVPTVNTPFWYTGSSNILTSSVGLATALNSNNKQIDIEGSGFATIEAPCLPIVGDEIRFEYDESLVYRISNVSPTGSVVYLTLDNFVPSNGFDVNHFTIRRKVKDAITGITLNNNLNYPIQSGYLLPEYPSEKIKNNISKITTDLRNRTLI